MKNYKEISTVVLFAILVHSALTASLVNIFMTLHGVGGGGDGAEWADKDLYFSDALRDVSPAKRGRGGGGGGGGGCSLSSSCTDFSTSSSSSSSYNFQQQQQGLSKKKILSDDNISLETYSSMLSKHRQSEGLGETTGGALSSKQSKQTMNSAVKFRYMR
jgi:hypothetical protein